MYTSIAQFHKFCVQLNNKCPPHERLRSATIADFLLYKSKQSERPESMLRSARSALTHYFVAIGVNNPFDNNLTNFITALIKSETSRAAGRTPIMPIKPFIDLFLSWKDNEMLSLKELRIKTITLLSISMLARCSDLAPANTLTRDQVTFNQDGTLTLKLLGIKNDYKRKDSKFVCKILQTLRSTQ